MQCEGVTLCGNISKRGAEQGDEDNMHGGAAATRLRQWDKSYARSRTDPAGTAKAVGLKGVASAFARYCPIFTCSFKMS